MGILTKRFTPAMETYLGKSKELIFIEKELDKIVAEIKKHHKPLSDDLTKGFTVDREFKSADIYKMKAFTNVEMGLQKAFKLKSFTLAFYHSVPYVPLLSPLNGYTLPYTCKFLYYDKTVKLDTTKMFIGVNIDFLLVSYLNLSGGELLAIILHEIGHNMDTSIFSYLSRLPGLEAFMKADIVTIIQQNLLATLYIDIFQLGTGISKVLQLITQMIDTIPVVGRLIELVSKSYLEFRQFLNLYNLAGADFSNIFSPEFFLRFISPRNLFGYGMEKYADSFASSYGYGPELANAFGRIRSQELFISDKVIYQIPGLNWCYDLVSLFIRVILSAADPHPTDIVRINAQLLKLKKDASDPNMNPKLRKELLGQVSSMQKYVDDYIDLDKNSNKRKIFSWMYNYITVKVMGNRVDYREVFELISSHEM